MMKYKHVVQGIFIRRVNRFIAEVYVNGHYEKVHVKNTGRLKELLVEGAKIALEESQNPNRKTKYSLVAVQKDTRWVNIDSQAPNTVVYDALLTGKIMEFGCLTNVKREVKFGDSRFDLYFEKENRKGFIEVKGVTLEKDGVAMFPDAPTERGTKHIFELMKAVKAGYSGHIFFLIQMEDCHTFTPNMEMDAAFSKALKLASKEGVHLHAYDTMVLPNELNIGKQIQVKLRSNV